MYILYTKIELQTNTHIPITLSPHRKHSSSPTYTKHMTHNNKNEVGIPHPLFQTHQLSHTVQMTLGSFHVKSPNALNGSDPDFDENAYTWSL